MSDEIQVFEKWIRVASIVARNTGTGEVSETAPETFNADHIVSARALKRGGTRLIVAHFTEYVDITCDFEVFNMALMGMVGPKPPEPLSEEDAERVLGRYKEQVVREFVQGALEQRNA